jgi:lipoic acid synthetase
MRRTCGFCGIKRRQAYPIRLAGTGRLPRLAEAMDLKHAVITSVNRDDRKG